MRKIAVTGALGAGKSTVCQIFAEAGAHVIDADKIAHELILGDCRQDIHQLLGNQIESNGEIDRRKIAKIVFKNPKKLKALEQILHPRIRKRIENTIQNHKHLIVAEIPLLFELGWDELFDATVCVTRQNIPKTPEWEERMKYQFTQEKKAQCADYIITNDGTVENLKKQIQNLKLGA